MIFSFVESVESCYVEDFYFILFNRPSCMGGAFVSLYNKISMSVCQMYMVAKGLNSRLSEETLVRDMVLGCR